MRTTPHERAARTTKAHRLARLIETIPAALGTGERPLQIALRMQEHDWALAAQIVGVRYPSERTRRQVVRVLATPVAGGALARGRGRGRAAHGRSTPSLQPAGTR